MFVLPNVTILNVVAPTRTLTLLQWKSSCNESRPLFLGKKSLCPNSKFGSMTFFTTWHDLNQFFYIKIILCFVNKTIFCLLINVIFKQVNSYFFLTYASFIIRLWLCLWPTDIKLFTSLIYECCRAFQPSLMFASKSSR